MGDERKYSQPVCRGSYALGTACGRCERCMEDRERLLTMPPSPDERGDFKKRCDELQAILNDARYYARRWTDPKAIADYIDERMALLERRKSTGTWQSRPSTPWREG